ncbi:CDK5 regulatory subunit-associated protein 2 isoform X2 [Narcine bancroftii]|uniref:CDK5 regulatory subunit-associated protein 2 isoform X2 n=1 Tax=Narcine bancroftii TaxID=1343680 RepID=UPI003831518D
MKMKGFCRMCCSKLQGNQRRWIFNTCSKSRLQIVLSYVLGYTVRRDGQGEFLCSKCAFMLEKVIKYDIVIARVKTVSSERLQMLTVEKDQLIQCIVHLYFRYNKNSKTPHNGEVDLSPENPDQPSLQYSLLLQDDSNFSEFWTPKKISKKILGCSNCWRSLTGGHRKRWCLCTDSVRVADLFCDLVCSTPKRIMKEDLTGNAQSSRSLCFDFMPRNPTPVGKLVNRLYTSNLETENAPLLNSIRLDWKTEECEQIQLKSPFNTEMLTENSVSMRQSIANIIQEIQHVEYKPVASFLNSKIPIRVAFSTRPMQQHCIAVDLQGGYNGDSATSEQQMWMNLEHDFPFKLQNLVEKQRQVGQLEMEAEQLKADLTMAETANDALQGKLKKAEDANETLQGQVNEKINELAAEKQNSLKRDKTIQGLTLALKTKDKEIKELHHEIEERDNSLVKVRDSLHKAQLQKFQGAEEYQRLMTEKESELAELRAGHNGKALEVQRLQRTLSRQEQELKDLTEAKLKLEEEVEKLQLQKTNSDKTINDIQNHIQKLALELAEKECAMQHQYHTLSMENKQKLHSQELVIERLTDSLNNKDRLLQEYMELVKGVPQAEDQSLNGKDALLAKLRDRLREKDRALEQAIDQKHAAIDEKENELQQLHLALREKEYNFDRLKSLLANRDETINSLDGSIKEKDRELQHFTNMCKNLQILKEELEDRQVQLLREKDAVILQLQQSLKDKTDSLEEMTNTVLGQSHCGTKDLAEHLNQCLKVQEKMLETAWAERKKLSSEHEKEIEELLNTINSKDQLLKQKLGEHGQKDQHLPQQEALTSLHVLELKQTIQILQEQLHERDAEQTQHDSAEDEVRIKVPRSKKNSTNLKKELAQKCQELEEALKMKNEANMEVMRLQALLDQLEKEPTHAPNVELLSKAVQVEEEIKSTQTLEDQVSEESLHRALKMEQQLYSRLVRSVKETDSRSCIQALQMELTGIQLLRQQLEESIQANQDLQKSLEKKLQDVERKDTSKLDVVDFVEVESLRHQLEDPQCSNVSLQSRLGQMQARVGATNDSGNTFTSSGDQTSYLSICLGQFDDLEQELVNLSLLELRQKVIELLKFLKALQANSQELQDRISTSEHSILCSDSEGKQNEPSLAAQVKLHRQRLEESMKLNGDLQEVSQSFNQLEQHNVGMPKHDKGTQPVPEFEAAETGPTRQPTTCGLRTTGENWKFESALMPNESAADRNSSETTKLFDDLNKINYELEGKCRQLQEAKAQIDVTERQLHEMESKTREMEAEVGPIRSLMEESGVSSVTELRNEIVKQRSEITQLRDQLAENLLTSESEDEEMDDESKGSLIKTVSRLRVKLRNQRKVHELLKQQQELLETSGKGASFNPDLTVSMAKEIEHLKENLESANQEKTKVMKTQEGEGLQESKWLQSQPLKFRNHKGKNKEQISPRSRIPVPLKQPRSINNVNTATTGQDFLSEHQQVNQLRAALKDVKLLSKLHVAEATPVRQAEKLRPCSAPLHVESSLKQDDKEVQVDLQDLGYETCGKSETDADRDESSSPDTANHLPGHCYSDAAVPSLLKLNRRFFSMENLDTNSSTSYPSSPSLISPKISLKNLDVFDDYGQTDDISELKLQIGELKEQIEKYQKVLHHLQTRARKNSLSSDQLTISDQSHQTPIRSSYDRNSLEAFQKENESSYNQRRYSIQSSDLAVQTSHQVGSLSNCASRSPSVDLGSQIEKGDWLMSVYCQDGQLIQKLKEQMEQLEDQLQKEKARNEELHDQLQSKLAAVLPTQKYDSLVQSQARELSYLRQQIKENRNICCLHHQSLVDLTKAFEELLQASDVDYYVGEAFRDQLKQNLQLVEKLESKFGGITGDASACGDNTLVDFSLSPRSLQCEILYLRKQLESERRHLHKRLNELLHENQALSQASKEQLALLKKEVQEKNKTICYLEQQLRVSSISHVSSDSEILERISIHSHDGRSATPEPPDGESPTDHVESRGSHTSDWPVGNADAQTLYELERENSALRDQLMYKEELNETLRTELDLHRSILTQKQQNGDNHSTISPNQSSHPLTADKQTAVSPEPKNDSDWHNAEDLLAGNLHEIRSLRHRLEESIRNNDRLRQQLECRLTAAENDPASTNIFIHGANERIHMTDEIHYLKEQNKALKVQLVRSSQDKQKEAEKLRESLSKKTASIDRLRSECERVKRESAQLQVTVNHGHEERRRLKDELHCSREEINRLQQEVNLQHQLFSENQELLQSLRVELRVYEQLKENTTGPARHVSHEAVKHFQGSIDMNELVAEIRCLRIQLERSIQTNTALRQKLEEQLQQRQLKNEGSPSTININYLLTRDQRSVGGRRLYQDSEPNSSAEDCKENEQSHGFPTLSKSANTPAATDRSLFRIPGIKALPMEECDSSSYHSESSELSHKPSKLVPAHQMWADQDGQYVLGLLEDYNALCSQISEGRSLLRAMDTRLGSSAYHSTATKELEPLLKDLSSSVSSMQQVLEEAGRLLTFFWRVSLPIPTASSSSPLQQGKIVKDEISRLRKKLTEQEKLLYGTVKRLRSTNQLKEGMEKVIIDQLSLTHDVLKKARGNLETQPSEVLSLDGN